MFEMIKIIVEKLFSSFSIEDAIKSHKEKKLNEIGTELYLLYSNLNQIYINSVWMVKDLESFVSWMERKIREGEPDREYHTDLILLIQQQRVNIIKFVKSFKRLALSFQLISPEEYNSMRPLMAGKFNALSSLLSTLRENKFIDYNDSELKLLTDEYSNPEKRYIGFPDEYVKLTYSIEIENVSRLGQKDLKKVKNYLSERNPRERLEEIKNILTRFRKNIEDNFSVKDILLNVGDERCSIREEFIGFF